jgi:predicted RNase H-like HicB family nuclease
MLEHARRGSGMYNEFTAIIEKDDDWYIAYCPEVPGANGQGKTIDECKESLAAAISLILEDRRQDAIRGLPEEAIKEVIAIS